jgi:hypothetical protein
MRFQVFPVVKIQVQVFWVVTLCSVVDTNDLEDCAASIFRMKCMVHLGLLPNTMLFTLKMEATRSSKTLVSYYNTTSLIT